MRAGNIRNPLLRRLVIIVAFVPAVFVLTVCELVTITQEALWDIKEIW